MSHLRQMISLAVLSAPGLVWAESVVPAEANHFRQLYSKESPQWLEAVGKLNVPGLKYAQGRPQNHREQCSATLIAPPASTQANTIVTAWHCLEFYRDLSKVITFTLRNGTAKRFSIEARILEHGGGMHADWALLRLQSPVPASTVTALPLHSSSAATARSISMAGYSNDGEKSGFGEKLSYHLDCAILPLPTSSNKSSDCVAMKGASGGAVTQTSNNGQTELAGVISRGNGFDVSEYVPVALFRAAALAHF